MSKTPAGSANGMTIEALIPHRKGMLLIDRIICLSEQSASAETVVRAQWPTARSQGVDALVLIELVAQTAGLSVGWKIKRNGSKGDVQEGRGWMVGVKHASFKVDPIALGTRLTVETRVAFEFEQLTEINGVILNDDVPVAEVRLQVMHEEPAGND